MEFYCSCVFQLEAKAHPQPQAICTKSVYHSRGLAGPGAMACRFTKRVLESFDVETLRDWLVAKGVPRRKAERMSAASAAALIHDYMASAKPKRAIKVALVKHRSPRARRRSARRG